MTASWNHYSYLSLTRWDFIQSLDDVHYKYNSHQDDVQLYHLGKENRAAERVQKDSRSPQRYQESEFVPRGRLLGFYPFNFETHSSYERHNGMTTTYWFMGMRTVDINLQLSYL
jgi:hypothetical protein